MTPQTVNAYYNPLMNQITFPAAILQPPYLRPDGRPGGELRSIGAIIGHEIGHGFDDQGRSSTPPGGCATGGRRRLPPSSQDAPTTLGEAVRPVRADPGHADQRAS